MEKGKIGILVYADDWEGLYVYDVLISEDHSLDSPEDWVKWTNEFGLTEIRSIFLSNTDLDELADYGNFPYNFKDFKDFDLYKEKLG